MGNKESSSLGDAAEEEEEKKAVVYLEHGGNHAEIEPVLPSLAELKARLGLHPGDYNRIYGLINGSKAEGMGGTLVNVEKVTSGITLLLSGDTNNFEQLLTRIFRVAGLNPHTGMVQRIAVAGVMSLFADLAVSDEAARGLFDTIDENGDGELDRDEVIAFAGTMFQLWHTVVDGGNSMHIDEDAMADYAKASFDGADADGNGMVDRTEFAVWFKEHIAAKGHERAPPAALVSIEGDDGVHQLGRVYPVPASSNRVKVLQRMYPRVEPELPGVRSGGRLLKGDYVEVTETVRIMVRSTEGRDCEVDFYQLDPKCGEGWIFSRAKTALDIALLEIVDASEGWLHFVEKPVVDGHQISTFELLASDSDCLGMQLRAELVRGVDGLEHVVATVEGLVDNSPLREHGVLVGDHLVEFAGVTLDLCFGVDAASITFDIFNNGMIGWERISHLFAAEDPRKLFDEYNSTDGELLATHDFVELVEIAMLPHIEKLCEESDRPMSITFSRTVTKAAQKRRRSSTARATAAAATLALPTSMLAPHEAEERATPLQPLKYRDPAKKKLGYTSAFTREMPIRVLDAGVLGMELDCEFADGVPGHPERVRVFIKDIDPESQLTRLGVAVHDELVSVNGVRLDVMCGHNPEKVTLEQLTEMLELARLASPPVPDPGGYPAVTADELYEEFDPDQKGILVPACVLSIVREELLPPLEAMCNDAPRPLSLAFKRKVASETELWRANVKKVVQTWRVDARKLNARVEPELPGEQTGGLHLQGEVVEVCESIVRILGDDHVKVRFLRLTHGCRGWIFDRTLKKPKNLLTRIDGVFGDVALEKEAAAAMTEEEGAGKATAAAVKVPDAPGKAPETKARTEKRDRGPPRTDRKRSATPARRQF